MAALRTFPRWLRVLLLAVNTAASLTVLALWYSAIWPNLAAGWIAAPTVVGPGIALLRTAARRLEARHQATRDHFDAQIAQHATVHAETLAVVSDQVAAVHARLDQDGSTP